MIYVFEDGRIIFGEENLLSSEEKYVAVETLPSIPPKLGMVGAYYAVRNEIVIKYYAESVMPEPTPEPVAPPEPTPKPVTNEEIKELTLLAIGISLEVADMIAGG